MFLPRSLSLSEMAGRMMMTEVAVKTVPSAFAVPVAFTLLPVAIEVKLVVAPFSVMTVLPESWTVANFLLSLPFPMTNDVPALLMLCTAPETERSLAPTVQFFTAVAFTFNPVPESAPAKLIVWPTAICESEEPPPLAARKVV